jgi:hypothetical protein
MSDAPHTLLAESLLLRLQPFMNLTSKSPDLSICEALRDFMVHLTLSQRKGTELEAGAAPKRRPKPSPTRLQKSGPPEALSPPVVDRVRKKKGEGFTFSVSRGVRHFYENYIREISTPDWAAPCLPAALEPPPTGAFDIGATHLKLEICEHRIINGLDRARGHPAMCLDAAEEAPEETWAPYEAARKKRYARCDVAERIPTFWPARPWDTDAAVLSPDASERLRDKLREQGVLRPPLPQPSAARKPPEKKPKRIRPTTVAGRRVTSNTSLISLNFRKFLTDDSDDETDWEDF